MCSNSRSVRIRQVTEPRGCLSENDLPAAFLFSFAFVKLNTGIDPGHSLHDTECKPRAAANVCPAACVEEKSPVLPVWQMCPQVNKMRSEPKTAALMAPRTASKGQ